MTKIRLFFRSDRGRKILASFLFLFVICSLFTVSASAEDNYQSIAPVNFTDFSGTYTAVAFPGPSLVELSSSTNGDLRTFLNSSDYTGHPSRIKYADYGSYSAVPYIQITLVCNYATVYLNSVTYSGSNSSSVVSGELTGVTEFICSPAQNSFSADLTYFYTWNIFLGDFFNYDSVYQDGFNAGVSSDAAKDRWYTQGYEAGLEHGLNSNQSESFGSNLLGDTLSAPMKALNQFVIYEAPSGFSVTLGGVVGAAISLTLFIAFLKIFAGG